MEQPTVKDYYDTIIEVVKTYPEYEGELFERAMFENIFNKMLPDHRILATSDKMEQELKDVCWSMWQCGAKFDYKD